MSSRGLRSGGLRARGEEEASQQEAMERGSVSSAMHQSAKRTFKDQLYEQLARIGKALASPHRLELLDLLAQCERSVEALARETGLPLATVSQHLQVLRAARLVETRRQGRSIHYRLASTKVTRLWLALRRTGEAHLAELERLVSTWLPERQQQPTLSIEAALQLLHEGHALLLDVRPRDEYLAAHLPLARALPVVELEAHLSELPRDCEVIAYCRGPYCVFADEAVALLRAHGYRARRLEVGVPEWQERGLPVVSERNDLAC
jgi:DNA-binding transcriptional ArsR family regulator